MSLKQAQSVKPSKEGFRAHVDKLLNTLQTVVMIYILRKVNSSGDESEQTHQLKETNYIKCQDCGISYRYKEYERHREICLKRSRACGSFGCKFVGTPDKLEKHGESCRFRKRSSKHEGFKFETENVNEIKHHMRNCGLKPVKCDECGECFQLRNQQGNKYNCKCKVSGIQFNPPTLFPVQENIHDNKSSERKISMQQQLKQIQQTPVKDNSVSGMKNQSSRKSKSPQTYCVYDRSLSAPTSNCQLPKRLSCSATDNFPSLNRVAQTRNKFRILGSSYEDGEKIPMSTYFSERQETISYRLSTNPFVYH